MTALPVGVRPKVRSLLRSALDPGQRQSRRVWHGERRVHAEVRGLDRPRLVADLRERLSALEGVAWVWAPGPLGRVVVAASDGGLDTAAVIGVVEQTERDHGVETEPFPTEPEHPADHQALQRQTAALIVNLSAIGLDFVGRFARVTPIPVPVAPVFSVVDAVPRLRALAGAAVGEPLADLTLTVAGAVSGAVGQGALGLTVVSAHRAGLVAELRARERAWARREAQLCAAPGPPLPAHSADAPRPVPLPPGPVDRTAGRMSFASFAAAGATLAATRDPGHASLVMLSALPRAATFGREAFAAQMGRALARRNVLVIELDVLRRLESVDTVLLDGDVLVTGQHVLGELEVVGDGDALKLRRQALRVFDPDAPLGTTARGRWRLAPVDQLDAELPRGLKSRARRLAAGSTGVLGLVRSDVLVALVTVAPQLDPDLEALVDEVRRQGHRLLVAGRRAAGSGAVAPDEYVRGGARLAGEIRRLQQAGHVVALVSSGNGPALRAADCSIGLTRTTDGSAGRYWDADLLCSHQLSDAAFVVQGTAIARQVARRSAQLALAGAVLAMPLTVAAPAPLRQRGLSVVNSAILASIANGAWSGQQLSWEPRRPTVDPTPWHALPGRAVLRTLDTQPTGLSTDEAARRQRWQRLEEATTPGGFTRTVLEELNSPLTPVLAGGAGLSAAVGGVADAAIVLGVLGVNALVGGVQRWHTDRVIADLLTTTSLSVRVVRGGQPCVVPAEELVPGDVVTLAAGDAVPADCRILDATTLEMDESSLTGESLPVRKRSKGTAAPDLAERRSMLYEGTTVAAGEATAVVVATGTSTEAGRSAVEGALRESRNGVEQRLEALTRQTVPLSLIGGAAAAAAGALHGQAGREILGTGVGLAVAAVPEGLPILATLAQLSAARRLSARGALVRNPRTIEALGRVDTLCIDKTGTLTEGRISLRRVADLSEDEPVEALSPPRRAVLAAALRASPDLNGGVPQATDRSVIEGATMAGVGLSANGAVWERLAELPFEAARGLHACVGAAGADVVMSVKGAPEAVLPRCTARRTSQGRQPLTRAARRQLVARVEQLARQGLRVLAVAERPFPRQEKLRGADVAGLEVLGFLALADPVRATAARAIADVRAAGVSVLMITGDHPSTAEAVAVELGMLTRDPAQPHQGSGRIVTGVELDALDDDQLARDLRDVKVFARVTPTHKVRIVRVLQAAGRVVAMTGDGANDAPAIRLADVGVAIGAGGATPAARAAADVVIADDRVETLIDAIVEGRAMWASVRDALSILLGGNLGEIAYTVAASLVSPTPVINARQLLLVNLLTDMAPATAIALRPPRNTSTAALLREGPEVSLGSALTRDVRIRAATTAAGATGAYFAARVTGRGARARTVGLAALVGTQLGQTVATGGTSPVVLATGVASTAALVGIVQTPGLSQFFGCTPLGPVGWAIAGTSASAATAATIVGSRFVTGSRADKGDGVSAPQLPSATQAPQSSQPGELLRSPNEEETTMTETDRARLRARQETEAARVQAEDAAAQAAAAGEEAKEAGAHAANTAREVLAESAYATLGVGGVALDLMRQAPEVLRSLNRRTATSAKAVGAQFTRGFFDLSRRGHQLVGSVSLEARRAAATAAEARDSVWEPVGTSTTVAPVAEPTLGAQPGEVETPKIPPVPPAPAAAPESQLRAQPGDRETAREAGAATTRTAELEQLTLDELRERARNEKIEGRSTMNKQELVAALRQRA